MKKVIIISIVLSLLGAFAWIESSSLRQGQCEPILNFGGPNSPYCITTLFNIPGTFGAIIMGVIGGSLGSVVIGSLLGNFIFYFIMGCIILFIIKLFKKIRL